MHTILIVGVYPGFNTGYGKQTRFIVNYLIENGNKVIMYRSSQEPKDNIYLDDEFKKLYIKDFEYDRYDNFGFQQINRLTEKIDIDLIYALMDLCWVSNEPEITKCPKILHVLLIILHCITTRLKNYHILIMYLQCLILVKNN